MNREPGRGSLRATFAAAKEDGPSAASRASMWEAVSANVIPPSVAVASSVEVGANVTSGTSSVGKAQVTTLTSLFVKSLPIVGMGAVLAVFAGGPRDAAPRNPGEAPVDSASLGTTAVEKPSSPTAPPRASVRAVSSCASDSTPNASDSMPNAAEANTPGRGGPGAKAQPTAERRSKLAPLQVPTKARNVEGDTLFREATLLAEARRALRDGEAQVALAAVRTARSGGTMQLEPEALAIEARAFRLLGQEEDAIAREIKLRAAFPNHALAR